MQYPGSVVPLAMFILRPVPWKCIENWKQVAILFLWKVIFPQETLTRVHSFWILNFWILDSTVAWKNVNIYQSILKRNWFHLNEPVQNSSICDLVTYSDKHEYMYTYNSLAVCLYGTTNKQSLHNTTVHDLTKKELPPCTHTYLPTYQPIHLH